ncbi:MAG: PmoA family protein [Acidobacteria bacterium]|nr:PmoA family protein [Acidobacteriota bacterium]
MIRFAAILLLAPPTLAQVKIAPGSINIDVDGKPFTTFQYGVDAWKPFFAPLRSASGKIVTRRFPMEMIQGESRDHLHHRGLWFTYDDINTVKYWENDPSYANKPNKGRVVVKKADWKEGPKSGTLDAVMEWQDGAGKVQLVENRRTVVYSDPKLRIMDFHITLTAAIDVTIGDTKEGAFAIRLAEEFTERRGGKITNADGLETMKQIWGKRSNWVNYSAELQGEKLGVAIFDHPSNPGYPTRWHARDYGLFSLNPFGQQSFDPAQTENITRLAAGRKLNFVWRVVIHPDEIPAADLYKAFLASHHQRIDNR